MTKNKKMDEAEEAPPIFKTWKRFYFIVSLNLVILIILFYTQSYLYLLGVKFKL